MKLVIVCLMLLTTACHTIHRATHQTIVKSWIGAKEDKLYLEWGVPTASVKIDDKKIIEYRDNGPINGSSWNGWSQYNQSSCSTKFIISSEGIIEKASWNGQCG